MLTLASTRSLSYALPFSFAFVAFVGCGDGDAMRADAHVHEHHDDASVVDASVNAPALLSETGLYADLATRTLAADVMAYDVRFPLYSDGADKSRFLSIPEGTVIDTRDEDAWSFPVGTRAWKEFSVDGVRIETRLLHKTASDRWERVAYVWRQDGTDADIAPEGVVDVSGTSHDVPDVAGCISCHQGARDGLLGVSAIQLATGGANEPLSALQSRGWLSAPVTTSTALPGTELEQRALGYLHANCGHCHNDIHPLSRWRSIRFRLPLGLTDAQLAPAVVTLDGAPMGHEIDGTRTGLVRGDANGSQLWRRMQHRGDGMQMPPLGTEVVDAEGVELIRRWIAALDHAP